MLSYDQLRIILERIPPDSATPYYLVAPLWETSRLDRVDLFLAGIRCKVREPSGSTTDECERYLYIKYFPGCLHKDDWHAFWRAP